MTTAKTSIDLRSLDHLAKKWTGVGVAITRDSQLATQAADFAAQILTGVVRKTIMQMPANNRSPMSRTGNLARSFRPKSKINQRTMHIASVSDLVYARIQDVGGYIRPKSVRNLAIPLISMPHGKWPRHWKRGELFRRGNALSRRRGNAVENVYALAKSVRLRPKRYSEKAVKAASPQVAQALIERLILKGLRDGAE